jgi:hypothetical protein
MTATAAKRVTKRLTFRAGLIILTVCALVAGAVTMGLQTGYAFKNILELWGVVFLGVLAQAVLRRTAPAATSSGSTRLDGIVSRSFDAILRNGPRPAEACCSRHEFIPMAAPIWP